MAVGIEDIDHLARIQARRLAEAEAAGEPAILRHVTRNTPRRAAEVLDGGSLYWIIRGSIRVRQRLLALEPVQDEAGRPACGLRLEPLLVRTVPRPQRAMQGWRYLDPAAAPPDLDFPTPEEDTDALPPALAEELRTLGLL